MSGPLGSSQWMYASGEDYTIDQSLRFNDNDSPYLNRTMGSSPTSLRIWTLSFWIKRSTSGATQYIFSYDSTSNPMGIVGFNSSDQFLYYDRDAGSGAADIALYTTQKFRDPTAWYHFLIKVDTTQQTASNRVKIYLNGTQITAWATETYPAQNHDCELVDNHNVNISGWGDSTPDNSFIDGYLAEMHFVDGTALLPTSFGETGDYGEWKPIEPSLTYGTNGFYLPFSVEASVEEDRSGNGNNFNSVNIATSDVVLDSPTNNFATFNSLDTTTSGRTLLEGNSKVSCTSAGCNISTIGMSSGKWYAEVYFVSGTHARVGICNQAGTVDALGATSNTWAKINNSARLYHNASAPSYGVNWDATEICMVAFDADAGKIWYGVDGTWDASGNPATASNPSQSSVTGEEFFFATSSGSGTLVFTLNCGQDSSFAGAKTAQGNQDGNDIGDFYYTPPSGFLALCTSNLPAVAVVPSEHFNTVLYTGDGNSTHAITGVGFQPDFLWVKNRSAGNVHSLQDIIRTPDAVLQSQTTEAQNPTRAYINSFDSDGFTTGNAAGASKGPSNNDGDNYVAWNWKAAGGTATNTAGNEDTTVSVNSDAGFSIVKWTNDGNEVGTRGHGLSKAPEMIITKLISGYSAGWGVYHKGIAVTDHLRLDGTNAASVSSFMNNTAPTSTVFSVGTPPQFADDSSSNPVIAYAFHSVDGYSKVGSYEGNGSPDGTFVYTGFRPAWVML